MVLPDVQTVSYQLSPCALGLFLIYTLLKPNHPLIHYLVLQYTRTLLSVVYSLNTVWWSLMAQMYSMLLYSHVRPKNKHLQRVYENAKVTSHEVRILTGVVHFFPPKCGYMFLSLSRTVRPLSPA